MREMGNLQAEAERLEEPGDRRSLRTGLRIQRLEGGRNQERGKKEPRVGRQAGPEYRRKKVELPRGAATGLK